MAVHADERGPPMQGTPTVHDETGTLQSPGPQKN